MYLPYKGWFQNELAELSSYNNLILGTLYLVLGTNSPPMSQQNLNNSLWSRFGAALEMLAESIQTCPKDVWEGNQVFSFQAYHTLFFLDYYLSTNPVGFAPPSEFSYSEFDEEPEIVIFSQALLLKYLDSCRQKAQTLIVDLDEQLASQRWINESKTMDYSLFEILLYNLRHVQHHVGQLNLLLRQHIDHAPEWIEKASR
jgi:hypothetical protein